MKMILILITAFFLLTSCSSDEDRLFRAIKRGDLQEVRSMVKNGASLLSFNKNGLSPLEVARINGQTTIADFILEEIKIVLDREVQELLGSSFSERMKKLKAAETERKKHYDLYLESNEKLISLMSDDVRLSTVIIEEQEKHFRSHQELVKVFINAKVDLIEDVLKELVRRNRLHSFESQDARHIVNVSIMYRLGKM